jgi:hypothetical protein
MLSSVTVCSARWPADCFWRASAISASFWSTDCHFYFQQFQNALFRFPKQIHHPSEKPAAAFFDNLKGGFQFLWQSLAFA